MAIETPGQGLGQRLDLWLWRARFFKSRALAARVAASGAVRIFRNATTIRAAKASFVIKIGDHLSFADASGRVRAVEVLDCGMRRGPAKEAVALYAELASQTPSDDDLGVRTGI